ncbi:MAG: hypothetical protein ACKV2T_07550 [Kofleriaceae bacterium]
MTFRSLLPALLLGCGRVNFAPAPTACPFEERDPGWSVAFGFRASILVDGIGPTSLLVAGGAFGGLLYATTDDNRLLAIEPDTGETHEVSATWTASTVLLTGITWDEESRFDGAVYVASQGEDLDGDSTIFRVDADHDISVFAQGPGPGLDDTYGMAFSSDAAYGRGLLVTGDTDDADFIDWGLYNEGGTGTSYFDVPGVAGIAFDRRGQYGGGLFAAMPGNGGFTGVGAITRIGTNGLMDAPLTVRSGVHAIAFAPVGPFSGLLYATTWDDGELFGVTATGSQFLVARGLQLRAAYQANAAAFSPDGTRLYVADTGGGAIVCVTRD